MSLFKPSGKGMRGPNDNNRMNGRVSNPPRYAQLGGLTSQSKVFGSGDQVGKIKKPGGGAK